MHCIEQSARDIYILLFYGCSQQLPGESLSTHDRSHWLYGDWFGLLYLTTRLKMFTLSSSIAVASPNIGWLLRNWSIFELSMVGIKCWFNKRKIENQVTCKENTESIQKENHPFAFTQSTCYCFHVPYIGFILSLLCDVGMYRVGKRFSMRLQTVGAHVGGAS